VSAAGFLKKPVKLETLLESVARFARGPGENGASASTAPPASA
jgi:hypothetical protein